MKFNPTPLAPSEAKYTGPGWHEWVFGLLMAGVGVVEVSNRGNFARAQFSYNYYAELPGVLLIHNLALVVIFVILATLSVWIAFPKFQHTGRMIVSISSICGFALIWIELIRAAAIRDPRFILYDLPLHPINNWGLIGSTIFAGYLILKLPSGKLKPLPANFIKSGFALSLYAIQFIIFETAGAKVL